MSVVGLVHWNRAEAVERIAHLRAAGYEADHIPLEPPVALRKLRESPPSAIVIDLSRLPSQGRDMALAFRSYKAIRHMPLVFVEGDPEKVERIKQLLPDAVYTQWSRIRSSLKFAINHPPVKPIVPSSRLEGYSGTPLPKKLGIKPGSIIVLVNSPVDFKKTLGSLPRGAMVQPHSQGRRELTIWFVMSKGDLEHRVRRMAPLAENGGLWIAWPKKRSRTPAELTQVTVRRVALAAGIVDYKIASINSTWSGLRFTVRKLKLKTSRPNTLRK